jgi:hypothetical protein
VLLVNPRRMARLVLKEYGIPATPVAFLIGEDGVIARHAAVGRDALLALVRDRRGGQKEEWNERAFGRHIENYCQLDLETRSIQAGRRSRGRRPISFLGLREGFPWPGGAGACDGLPPRHNHLRQELLSRRPVVLPGRALLPQRANVLRQQLL